MLGCDLMTWLDPTVDDVNVCAMPQENYRKDLSLKDAEVMALSTLKEVMEEKVKLHLLASCS